MAGRRWTEEELVTLEEMIDTHTVEVIARRLDRSFDSVNIKLNRMGLSGFAKSTDLLTMNQVCLMMGVESRTVKKKWCSKGLHFMRKGNYLVVKQQALLKYLEQHPEDWNAADVTEDSMLLAYPWYREKRKADTKSHYHWTQREITELHFLRRRGFTIREIAEHTGRSESSIKYKLYRRN